MTLTGKQRRHLRGLGHALEPIVQVGKDGVTDALVSATEAALAQHELIKIRVGGNAPDDRHDVGEALAQRAHAELVQVLGNTVLLYKPDPKEPRIALPKGAG
jgi:RNA-binding protein